MITHKKAFGVYHWDTFDHETICVAEADTLEKAEAKVQEKYGSRINPNNGADQVDIVDQHGRVIRSYKVC